MAHITVRHYDAFSSVPGMGNPAGVVFDADHLNENEMQAIARRVGFNETVFVLRSEQADVRLRYFTPGHEINLCGHATVGAMYAMKTGGLLRDRSDVRIETKAGILPVGFEQKDGRLLVRMKQDQPRFAAFAGDRGKLAESIGLERDDLDPDLPVVYGSTGTWTLLVPIRGLDKFARMKPANAGFPEVLIDNPGASVHPFCMDAYDKAALMHARHFSSPYSGTVEDPVTGTASGVMGAYYLTYVEPGRSSIAFTVEQGQEIGRDGRVRVEAARDEAGMDVRITGTAAWVRDFVVEIGDADRNHHSFR